MKVHIRDLSKFVESKFFKENKKPMEWKWLVLFGALWSRIITTGTVVCMGAFFDSVEASFRSTSAFGVSMAFAVGIGLVEGMGFANRLLIQKFEARYLVLGGALVAAAGVIGASFTSNYVIFLGCFGFMNGIGQSMARFIMPTAVGYVFDDRSRHVGLAVMNSGDGVGGVLAPILLLWMIKTVEWRQAMFITGAVVLNLCVCAVTIPAGLFLKKSCGNADQEDAKASQKLVARNQSNKIETVDNPSSNEATATGDKEVSLVQEIRLFPNILFFYLNIATHSIGYFIFMTFVFSDLAAHKVDSRTTSFIVSLIGSVSIAGRLGVSLVSNWRYLPRWSVYALGHVVRGVCVLATLMAPGNVDGCVVWYAVVCSVFGFSDGTTGALIPIVIVDLFGLGNFASVLGGEMMIMGSGAIIGVPIAGFLKDMFHGYTMPFIFSGCSFIFSGLILLPFFCTEKDYELRQAQQAETKSVELVDVKPRKTSA